MYQSAAFSALSNGSINKLQGVYKKESSVKTKPRKKWKKPKDKPKRPLSAYNFFFRAEREKLMFEMQQGPDKNGKVGFAALAKHIAPKWKQLDPESRKIYEAKAEIEQERYKTELDEWRRKQDLKSPSHSLSDISKQSQEVPDASHNATFPSAEVSLSSLDYRDDLTTEKSSKFDESIQQRPIARRLQGRRLSLPLGIIESSSCNALSYNGSETANVAHNSQTCEQEHNMESQNDAGVDQDFLKQYGHLSLPNIAVNQPQRRFSMPQQTLSMPQESQSDLEMLSLNFQNVLQGSEIDDVNPFTDERNDSFDDEVFELFRNDNSSASQQEKTINSKQHQRQRHNMSMPMCVVNNQPKSLGRLNGYGESQNTQRMEYYPEAARSYERPEPIIVDQSHPHKTSSNAAFLSVEEQSFNSWDQEATINYSKRNTSSNMQRGNSLESRGGNLESKSFHQRQRRSMSMPMGSVNYLPEPVAQAQDFEGCIYAARKNNGRSGLVGEFASPERERSEFELYEFLKVSDLACD